MSGAIDLNDMIVFAAVAQARSFSKAAETLGMPKSTVSRRISALESHLGTRLLQRTTRKLSLTDAGADYAERCRSIQVAVEDANDAVLSSGDHPRGLLRITAPYEIGRNEITTVLADYCADYPEVEIEAHYTDHMVDLVGEGYDLAIRTGDLIDSSMVARRLGPTQRFLCASPDYVARKGAPQEPLDLPDHDIVVFDAPAALGGAKWTLAGPNGEIEVTVRPRISVNDFDSVAHMVRRGFGIGLIASWVCHEDLRSGRLARVLEEHSPKEASIYAIYPSRRLMSAKLRCFLDLLMERLSPPPWVQNIP